MFGNDPSPERRNELDPLALGIFEDLSDNIMKD